MCLCTCSARIQMGPLPREQEDPRNAESTHHSGHSGRFLSTRWLPGRQVPSCQNPSRFSDLGISPLSALVSDTSSSGQVVRMTRQDANMRTRSTCPLLSLSLFAAGSLPGAVWNQRCKTGLRNSTEEKKTKVPEKRSSQCGGEQNA